MDLLSNLVQIQCQFGATGLLPYPLKWAKELVQSVVAFPASFRYASNVGHQELAKRYPKLREFQPFVDLVALKLEADVFELVGCHIEDCSVSQADYSCAAIWHKIMGSWSLAKAGEAGGVALLAEAALLAVVVVLGGLGDLGGLELLASADFAPVQKVAAVDNSLPEIDFL